VKLDSCLLTVALNPAKRMITLFASRSNLSLFGTDEESFVNALMWKNLLLWPCTALLWEGERAGKRVAV
jgi:hypothetical protein